MRKIPFLFFLLATCFLSCTEIKDKFSVYDLRCENLTGPLGIATTEPGFSWKIKSEANGTTQQAFQVIVASRKDLLTEDKADLWNSGKTSSPESVFVKYSGKGLNAGTEAYWKVRVWDENDRSSGWSEISEFSIGLLNETDWQAKYIGFPVKSDYTASPILKKTFDLEQTGEKVFLYVNSLGYHEVYLNGEKISDIVLAPAVSQFTGRSQVMTYDISSYLKKGRNDLVLWIGQGWYSKGLPGVVDDGPFVRAQAEMVSEGKRKIILLTDSSWSGRKSGYATIGTWRPHRFGGEEVDASYLMDGLSGKSLDEAKWAPVYLPQIPAHKATSQLSEPNRIIKTITAASINQVGDSTWVADMGTTLTGYAEILFPQLKKGEKVIMEYCDHLDEQGNTVNMDQKDIFISVGRKDEVFRNRFNYHGFRYIRISGLSVKPEEKRIKAHLIHTDYRMSSTFGSSDPDLNRIYIMLNYTLRCLSLGGYLVDCPQIERLGYGGDGNASTETAQTFFDLGPLYSNWLQAWGDCIREDGGMPHTAPNPYPAGGGPYWCGFIITASWRTYCNYGDKRILEKYYPVMQKWLEYVDKYSKNGMLGRWPDTDYRNWYLGDWAVPKGTDQTDTTSVRLVNNSFVAVCYETMEKIAGVLGKKSEARDYQIKKEAIRNLLHETFYDDAKASYASGSQIDLTYPLLAGVVPDSLAGKVKNSLHNLVLNEKAGHFATGLVGIPVFTEYAVKKREYELMYTMLKKRDYPGYLYMIDNGATTTWEHWDGARSRIHNCYNGIGSWFIQGPGGIRNAPESPGYRHIIIDPQIPEGLKWVNVTKETPYGTVSVKWEIINGNFSMEVVIPVGSTATITVPQTVKHYRMNRKNYANDSLQPEVASGKYLFEWEL